MSVREILLVLLLAVALGMVVTGVKILFGDGPAFIAAGMGVAGLAILTLAEVRD